MILLSFRTCYFNIILQYLRLKHKDFKLCLFLTNEFFMFNKSRIYNTSQQGFDEILIFLCEDSQTKSEL